MDKSYIDSIKAVEQPKLEKMGFIEDLKSPLKYYFGENAKEKGFLSNGVRMVITYPHAEEEVETAFESLRRVLTSKGVPLSEFGSYTLFIKKDTGLAHEEYVVSITEGGAEIIAGDSDGLRRAIYFFEDKLCEVDGQRATVGGWRRKPFVKNRISRCFFGPTYRPPFFIDELTNDVDYYPDEYLNKLAHEGINGVWLSMYFASLPSSIFPNRGKDAEKRFAKLRKTVEKCARYGIKIFVYICEPKPFRPKILHKNDPHWSDNIVDIRDALDDGRREMLGFIDQDKATAESTAQFCTSSKLGQEYLRESVTTIFKAVPNLGGLINIILGEDNGSCAHLIAHGYDGEYCPLCGKRPLSDLFREQAKIKADAMHAVNPDADMIEWFYLPGSRDGKGIASRIQDVVRGWPDGSIAMLNFESGAESMQLGKKRMVFDYSLAFVGPSEQFRGMAETTKNTGAKLQVGCSHEDASVPFIPVPSNLYEKYKFLNEHDVSTVMQCWYFGNYPGLMNKAAGELSFRPFPKSEDEFLKALAAPFWREHAATAVEAWKHFARGYRNFPSNIEFAWYGPLHHAIAWPLYLYPVDMGITPSWLLKTFPEVSGDRFGETLVYQHTGEEALTLCNAMRDEWKKGVEVMNTLTEHFANNPDRLADITLAQAILLQIEATCDFLKFYLLREDMFYFKHDNTAEMKEIVKSEIANSRAMIELCRKDGRLGYHSEAEGYLFFPEKLEKRIDALNALLKDFDSFSLDAEWIREYTGEKITGPSIVIPEGHESELQSIDECGVTWSASRDKDNLYVTVHNRTDRVVIQIEPCRMWSPVIVVLNKKGQAALDGYGFRHSNPPEIGLEKTADGAERLSIPMSIFDGYRREGFPMRMNIRQAYKFWIKGELWPYRLTHEDFNPKMAAWMIF